MRFVLPLLLVLGAPLTVHGSVKTVNVTKDSQAKVGVEFTLTTEMHPDPTMDTLWVKIVLEKKDKLERLRDVLVQIKEGNTLPLRVPLALRQEGNMWVGSFHMSPAQAKKCVLRLECPALVNTAVTVYEVQLGSYLGK
jgi:hypothetical protein